MGNLIFDDMIWSYSRLSSFESCPHKFFLTYLYPAVKRPQFFSSYGSFFHEIMDAFYSGKLRREELLLYYMTNFHSRVHLPAPSQKIMSTYYRDGVNALMDYSPVPGNVLACEQEVSFSIADKSFVGVQDLILEDRGQLVLLDHKSRSLKPRSGRKKPTKSDLELDRYLRQLYLYSIPVFNQYGKYPDMLVLNCYRTNVRVVEPFCHKSFEQAQGWALQTIDRIAETEVWYPELDFCRCRHLCDVNLECEYCAMEYGDPRRY